MIIFYNNQTGDIVGTIEGRQHDEAQSKVTMSISTIEPTHVDKIICQWHVAGFFVEDHNSLSEEEVQIRRDEKKTVYVEFEPEHEQKEIFAALDKNSIDAYKYKVDINTKKLQLNSL